MAGGVLVLDDVISGEIGDTPVDQCPYTAATPDRQHARRKDHQEQCRSA
jgi:hypothetical protein